MNIIKLAAASVIITASLNGGVALAQAATCTISGTGPGSNNVCQFDSNDNVIYTCVNNILVVNGTDQAATTGIVQTANNTHVGAVGTGSAINVGETTTNVNATCLAAAPTPAPTPTPTPTPTPGRGNEGQPTPAPRPPVVTSLPDTGGSAAELAGIAAAGSIVAALGVTVAARAYRHYALKDLS